MPVLIVNADDYGYRPAYDRGILEAAAAGAVDAVSVMVLRTGLDAGALLESGVEVGLHLELADAPEGPRAAERAVAAQLNGFQRCFARPPAHIDGHHHRHAGAPYGAAVARAALELGVPVRSVDARHRRTLRCLGVSSPDRLIGRLREREPALPAAIERLLAGRPLPAGVTEWMVHPGRRDPEGGSSYDDGREEDLLMLLELARAPALRAVRADHRSAL